MPGSRAAACSRTAAASASPVAGAASGTTYADQPPVARGVLAGDHRGLGHARAGGQHRVHLARLDPEPADLDLLIRPAREHQLAVTGPLGQVPGPVHPLPARPERARDKPLRCQGRPGPGNPGPAGPRPGTAPRPSRPAPGPATHPAHTARIFAAGVPTGTTPPASTAPAQRASRRADRRLRRAVMVDHHPVSRRGHGRELGDPAGVGGLAAQHQRPARQHPAQPAPRRQHHQMRRHRLQVINPVRGGQPPRHRTPGRSPGPGPGHAAPRRRPAR